MGISRARAVLLVAVLAGLAPATAALGKGPAAPKPPPAGQIAGVIRDVGGYFVVDAQVTATWDGAKAPVTTKSDAQGAFLVKGVPPGAEATLLVKGKGTVPDERKVLMPKDKGVLLEVTLRAGILFGGKVVDKRGNPIAGARIDPIMKAMMGKLGRVTFESSRDDERKLASVLDGSFAVDNLSMGSKYVLRFSHPHFATLHLAEILVEPGKVRDDLVATMEDAAWIVGVVVDAAGKPVPKAKVTTGRWWEGKTPAKPPTTDELEQWAEDLRRGDKDPIRTTNDKGGFVVGGLVGTEVELTVQADGFYDATLKVEGLVAGFEKPDVKVTLEGATSTLEGRVVDAAGKPVANATIRAHGDAGDMPEAKANAEGKFKIPRVKSRAPVSLSVRAEGYLEAVLDGVTLGAKDVLVTMQKAATLHLIVVDEDGMAFDQVVVRTWLGAESPKDAVSRDWDFLTQGKTGFDVSIPIGEVHASVSVGGYVTKTIGPWTTTVGQKLDGGTVKLARKPR